MTPNPQEVDPPELKLELNRENLEISISDSRMDLKGTEEGFSSERENPREEKI